MSDQMSLDGILKDEKPAAPATEKVEGEAAPAVEVEKVTPSRKAHQEKEFAARMEGEGRVRDPETGQYVKKDAVPEKPPAEPAPVKTEPEKPAAQQQPQFSEKERAFLAAAQEERRKRQALEERIKAMEAAAPKEPAKTFWDDPEAAIKSQAEQNQLALMKMRVDTSEMIARSKHTDFDEKANVFRELVQENPWLYQEMMRSVDPADYAYRQAKNHMELKAAGSVEALRTQIAKEERAKLELEIKAKQEALEHERAALPKSLSDVRGTTVNKQVWGGPPSLDNILKP